MWDPSLCSADDLFRANVICLEKQIDDPLTQINGVVAILDMKFLGFHHVRHFSPSHAFKIVSLVQVSIFLCDFAQQLVFLHESPHQGDIF